MIPMTPNDTINRRQRFQQVVVGFFVLGLPGIVCAMPGGTMDGKPVAILRPILTGALAARAIEPDYLSVVQLAGDSMSASSESNQNSDFVTAIGQADLAQGVTACYRVADTVARAEIARQIQIFVEEIFTQRLQQHTNESTRQNVEITLKETARELLNGVRIISRTLEPESRTCSSTAVMLKRRIIPEAANKLNTP